MNLEAAVSVDFLWKAERAPTAFSLLSAEFHLDFFRVPSLNKISISEEAGRQEVRNDRDHYVAIDWRWHPYNCFEKQ